MPLNIFYKEDDFDCITSAAICKSKHSKSKLIPVKDQFPIEKVKRIDAVCIIGCCPEEFETLENIWNLASVLWIIDNRSEIKHTAETHNFKERLTFPSDILYDTSKSNCSMIYSFLNEGKNPNYFLTLVSNYVRNDHEDDNTLPFIYGLKSWLHLDLRDPQNWKRLVYPLRDADQKHLYELIQRGKHIKSYLEKENEKAAKKECFEMTFEGHKAIAVSRPYVSREFFDPVYNPKKHDLKVCFGIEYNMWKVIIYSDKVDVYKLTEKYGGFGSASTVLFRTKKLPKEFRLEGK